MELAHKKTVSIVYTAGLFAVYLGQRVLGPGAASTTATTLGLGAIVAAIIATTPVVLLPMTRIMEGEKIGRRSLIGALVAVSGVIGLTFFR